MLKITLTRGLVGKTEVQRKVVAALGLGKFGSSVVHADSPTIRGMIRKVHHLVTVVPAAGDEAKAAKARIEARAKAKTTTTTTTKKPVAAKA
ncbi:MAG: 50S ribosomal protein L30 [Terriglobales bacterium]